MSTQTEPSKSPSPEAPALPRVHRPTPAEFRDIFEAQRPVVLTGVIEEWPLAQAAQGEPSATLERLTSLIGDRGVDYYYQPAGADGYLAFDKSDPKMAANFERRSCAFRDLAATLRTELEAPTGQIVYMGSMSIERRLEPLASHVRCPEYVPVDELEPSSPRIWIGMGGHRVTTHFDPYHNLLCLVAGVKRVTLFAPDQLPNMYMGPVERSPAYTPISLVDLHHVDWEKYPRFREALAASTRVDIAAGEVLFIPSFWWHAVESLGFNVMVNYWWDDCLGINHDALESLLAAAALARRMPPQRRAVLRAFFEYFVFDQAADPFPTVPRELHGVFGQDGLRLQARLAGIRLNKILMQLYHAGRDARRRWTGRATRT